MNAEMIYKTLQDKGGFPATLRVEDLILRSCNYQHYLRFLGTEPDFPEPGEYILSRMMGDSLRDRVISYVSAAYGPKFRAGHTEMVEGVVAADIAGWVGDHLLEVAVVTNRAYSATGKSAPTKIPDWVKVVCSVKALIVGASRVSLMLVNKNNQQWSSWTLSGDFRTPHSEVMESVREVSRLVKSFGDGRGIDRECKRCPYTSTCEAHTLGRSPPPFTVNRVSVIPDLGLAQSIDSYLWGLNKKPNNRSTHCIHPSEFSIFPCDKRIAYGLKGEEQRASISASLRRIFDMGHACHEILQDALEASCPDFESEVPVQWPSIKLSGSCDGVLGDTGYEIKSISDSGFQKLSGAKSEHRKQGTLYGVPLSLSQMNYMYVNKNTGEIAEYPVVIDKQLWHSMASRAEKIIKTIDEGEMPPETDKAYLCKQCPYCWTCKPSLWRSYE